jgi:hypothetical protein
VLTAFVGLNQLFYVWVGACPASLILGRLFGLHSAVYPADAETEPGERQSHPLDAHRIGA